MQTNELIKTIHDASIIGIYSETKDKLVVRIETDQNLKLKIEFFRFTDFCSQNIISRIIFSSHNEFSEQVLMTLLEWGTSTSDGKSYLDKSSINKYLDQLKSLTLNLIYFEPSCGVEGVVVSRHFQIVFD